MGEGEEGTLGEERQWKEEEVDEREDEGWK